ncbi:MAG: DegT/DnrJ/EryC1/StrS family aminotransferase [Prevotella sp.]|nr:DegT/DnrJ/EryC1/StrS family aminotransferase [Prevotella sp.]
MSRKLEIGSNFWLTSEETRDLIPLKGSVYGLDKWKYCVLTSSGRGAIKLLFQQLPQVKRVLLPIYTCSSVINPIESLGIECIYYPINKQLEVDIDGLMDLIEREHPDSIYFQSYYGFDTLASVRPYYHDLQDKNIIVVEDITHSWLSDFNTTEADYSVVSLRKWLQLPDGGALMSNKHVLGQIPQYGESDKIVVEFVKASEGKERYFQTHNPADKQEFRQHYVNAKDLLQQDDAPHRISNISCSVLAKTDFDEIIRRRRENATYLRQNLCNKVVEPCIPLNDNKATPLYFPIYVKDNRGTLQKELASHNIYCPVHWPMPTQVRTVMDADNSYIYDHVLSLICDQRYNLEDMSSIVKLVNHV